MFRNIVVAIDGSPTSMRGFRQALALAADQRATLHALHVVENYPLLGAYEGIGYATAGYIDEMSEALREHGRKVLRRAEAAAAKAGRKIDPVLIDPRGNSVADAVLGQARKLRADLIVLGTHGRRGLRRVVMGSDAEAIVRGATVPVLLVRGNHGPRRRERGAKKVRARAASPA